MTYASRMKSANKRAQKRARATGVVLTRKVISGARRFTPVVRRRKAQNSGSPSTEEVPVLLAPGRSRWRTQIVKNRHNDRAGHR